MYVTRNNPRALARIHAAIQAGLGYAYNAGETPGGGGGGGSETTTEEPPAGEDKKGKGKKAPAPDPDTLTMTVAERERLIADAVADHQRKADTKAAKEQADREAEEAKKRGEFEKVAATEKARADAAETKLRDADLREKLRSHIDEHKPEFAKAAGVIFASIDRSEADADKAIKAAVAVYEKSLPEKLNGSAGAPPSLPRSPVRSPRENSNRSALPNGNRIFSPSSRF